MDDMIALTIIEWSATLVCIVASVLLALKYAKTAFILWIVADLLWLVFAIYNGIWSQAALWSIYLTTGFWTIINWKKYNKTMLE